ncbi:MAG: hypothetical protein ACFB0C_19720 [Leptolyngbyaceae cyanobacterium]
MAIPQQNRRYPIPIHIRRLPSPNLGRGAGGEVCFPLQRRPNVRRLITAGAKVLGLSP